MNQSGRMVLQVSRAVRLPKKEKNAHAFTCNEAVRGIYVGIDTLQGCRDKAKLKWLYKLVTMPEDRYPKLFSQD